MQGAIPYVNDAHSTECNVGRPVFEIARPADHGRLALGLQLGELRRRDRPRHLPARRGADPLPRRLRPQRQRLPLALEPRGAAHRLRPHHRHRGGRAHLPHADRPDPDRGAPQRHRRAARRQVRPALAREGRARQPPVPRRALARRPGDALRAGAGRHAPRLERPGRRLRRLPAARATGTCATTSNSNGAILFRRFATRVLDNFQCLPTGLQGATCPGSELSDDPTRSSRPPTRSTRPAAASTSRTRS